MSDNRSPRGRSHRQRHGGRRGGYSPGRGSPNRGPSNNARPPRPIIRPGSEGGGAGAWQAFSANSSEINAQRVAQLAEERARIAAERTAQGLSAEPQPEITETHVTRGQDGSRTVATRTFIGDGQPTEPATSSVDAEHTPHPVQDVTNGSELVASAARTAQSSSVPIPGTEQAVEAAIEAARAPVYATYIPDLQTTSLPSTQQPPTHGNSQRQRTVSTDSHRSVEELQLSFSQSTKGYPVETEDITFLQPQPEEEFIVSENEAPLEEQSRSVDLPVTDTPEGTASKVDPLEDDAPEDENTSNDPALETKAEFENSQSESESETVSDEDVDLKGQSDVPDPTQDKIIPSTVEDKAPAEDYGIDSEVQLKFQNAYQQRRGSSDSSQEADDNASVRSQKSASAAVDLDKRQSKLDNRVSEIMRRVEENNERLRRLDRNPPERANTRKYTPPDREVLYGISTMPEQGPLMNEDVEDMMPDDLIPPLNVTRLKNSDESSTRTVLPWRGPALRSSDNAPPVRTAYSRFDLGNSVRDSTQSVYSIPSPVRERQQRDRWLKLPLPEWSCESPTNKPSSLHGDAPWDWQLNSENGSAKKTTAAKPEENRPDKVKKDTKRGSLSDSLATFRNWNPRHAILWTIYLIVIYYLASTILGLKDTSFKSSIAWTQELLPLETTSLLRAIEAESTLQDAIREASMRTNSSITMTKSPCSKFIEEQSTNTQRIYQAEQVTLAFIYSKILNDLQTTVFQHNITLQDLSNVYNEITKASQSLTNIDRQILQHIHGQRANSHHCIDTPGFSVEAQHAVSHGTTAPQSSLPRLLDPVFIWFKRFPDLARYLPSGTTAEQVPVDSNKPFLDLDSEIFSIRHATPFDNHFRAIERMLHRSQRGHKALRDELQRLDADLSTLSKVWFDEDQLVVVRMVRDWTKRFWQVGSGL